MMKIKICGLTTVDDGRMVAEAGADWIGLNFHPPSSRFVEEATAREIVSALPPEVEAVGLFVNRAPEDVVAVAHRVGLKIVQLHGDEPEEDLAKLEGLRVIRAFRVGSDRDVAEMVRFAARADQLGRSLEAALCDSRVEGQFGGTGRAIDPALLAMIRTALPILPPMILAGGLTPENVAENAAKLGPWMVDVAGGVESAPGRKDPARVRAFLRAARTIPPV